MDSFCRTTHLFLPISNRILDFFWELPLKILKILDLITILVFFNFSKDFESDVFIEFDSITLEPPIPPPPSLGNYDT